MHYFTSQLSADLSDALGEVFGAVIDIRDAAEQVLNQENGFPHIESADETHGKASKATKKR